MGYTKFLVLCLGFHRQPCLDLCLFDHRHLFLLLCRFGLRPSRVWVGDLSFFVISVFAIRSPGFLTVNNVSVSVFGFLTVLLPVAFIDKSLDKASVGISFCFRSFDGRSQDGGWARWLGRTGFGRSSIEVRRFRDTWAIAFAIVIRYWLEVPKRDFP